MTTFTTAFRSTRNFVRGRMRFRLVIVAVCLLVAMACWQLAYPAYLRYCGESALNSRRIPAALDWLARAEAVQPSDRRTQFDLARANRLSGRFVEMQTHLQKARDLGFPADRLKREQHLAMAQSGRIREIEPQLAELFSSPGEDGREICEAVVSGMFLCYRLQDAFTILGAWRRDYPTDPQPDVVEGLYNFQKRVWLKAAESFEKAIRLAPGRDDVRLHLADSLRNLQRLDEAQKNEGREPEEDGRDSDKNKTDETRKKKATIRIKNERKQEKSRKKKE